MRPGSDRFADWLDRKIARENSRRPAPSNNQPLVKKAR